ncbi:MAG: glycine cleavage system protein GcvH [Betaproteobacteria bacterium]|nr:glycine cleavage system protein GcvH [Betaproteobacteria bacterium]
MNIPADLKYTSSHEWIRTEADGTLTIGITDTAQEMLGDLVFVGDAKVGETLKQGDTACVVESVKAASDVYMPVDGEITAFNEELDAAPEKINGDAFGSWLFKVKPAAGASTAGLLDAAGYQAVVSAG